MKNDCRAYVQTMLREGLLKSQKVEFDRISRFLARAVKDLETARANLTIDEEAAYTFAYLGMLRAGRALVFLQGFRPVYSFLMRLSGNQCRILERVNPERSRGAKVKLLPSPT